MLRFPRTITFIISVSALSWGAAQAATVIQGEWETTDRIATPQGIQSVHERVCNHGRDLADILTHSHGQRCSAWRPVRVEADGADVLQSTCTQTGPFPGGSLTVHVEATVSVAADGRSAQGAVQATGRVNGVAFRSPSTQFTSRFIGACPGR